MLAASETRGKEDGEGKKDGEDKKDGECKKGGEGKKTSGNLPKTVTFHSNLPRNKNRLPTAVAHSSISENFKYCSNASMIEFTGNYNDFELKMQRPPFDDVIYEFGIECQTEADYHCELLQLCKSDWCSDSDRSFDEEEYQMQMELQLSTQNTSASSSTRYSTTYSKQSSLSLSKLRIASKLNSKRKSEPDSSESAPPLKRISLPSLSSKTKSTLCDMNDKIGCTIKFANENLDVVVAKKPSFTRHPSICFNKNQQSSNEFWNDLDSFVF